MTLPASGSISTAQIRAELGGGGGVTFPNAETRALTGIPAGSIVLPNSFHGRSAGGGGGGAPSPSASFIAVTHGNNTGVFAGVSFGAALSTRRVVVAVHWGEGTIHRSLSSATIGGVAATIHVQRGHTGGVTGLGSAIISAAVPTGATGTVDLTFAGAITDCSIGVYRLTGMNSSPTDTGSDQTTVTTGTLSVTVTVPTAGIVIAAYTGSTNTVGTGVTFGNATERYDAANTVRVGGAFTSGLLAGGRTITGSQGAIANSGNDMCVVTWG